MWIEFNNNPVGRIVGDCSVRAVSKALNVDWETAYAELASAGFAMGDLPNADATWGAVLRRHGFKKAIIPETCPDCYTAEDFAREHPHGVYVLGFGGHAAAVVNGNIYDSWNSSREVPVYVWYLDERKDV